MFKTLTPDILVAPQISAEAIEQAKALGVTLVVNNRPDGESDDQTPGHVIEAVARAAGMDYAAIPITHGGFANWQLDALDAVLKGRREGKVLCYCRSGMRSTLLWSLCQARAGEDPVRLRQIAADAGYDISPIFEMMQALSASAD